MLAFLENLLELCLEAAPWLLLGMIIGGLLKAWIPIKMMERHLGGQGFMPVVKAAILGAPLPLCSCGVIPAALALRKAGASKRATVSFLVSTPETGVDSVSITYALLGPFMAIVRPIASITSALVAGMLAGRNESPADQPATTGLGAIPVQVASCCSSDSGDGESSCCGGEDAGAKPEAAGFAGRTLDGLNYAFGQLLGDMLLWLAVGLIFAALVKTFVPATFLAQWGSGLPAMLLMTLIGIPMYVCATASTPIAAGLMLAGVSPGVALVFLMAGPATNIATLGIISKELDRRAIIGYLTGVIGVALLAG
ncbi:MAG TPA: permease, partial [Gammaproteobacteria bacterium]|nr:permease [Gammaproteobacteria bacterium]